MTGKQTRSRSQTGSLLSQGALTLAEALPREIVRVATEIMPVTARLGSGGQEQLDAMIGAIRLAGLALVKNDARLMRRAHDDLLGFHL
jgi:hypothetical protein